MGLKRPSRSIREVIEKMPEAFGKLAPCLMMSPLSIAQYLPAAQAPFDVVVFDEASQIATWDAIGAIARGKQTIIVGDPKQLPPTNFFGRTDSDEDDEEIDDFDKDLESILDEAQASGLPTLQLNWHYRSRHESLIAFSNWNYYGNNLVTFPAADSQERGVAFVRVKDGVYDRGKSRTNRLEAEGIVTDAVTKMKRCLAKPESERLTYGVVTFNQQQQSLILDLFDQARRDSPGLEWFFDDDSRVEPTMVRNLESVQGDERDVMYFSITFGKDAAGKFPVDFGAINREGGERRLNVAITRAREALLVYASFLPDEVRAERAKGRGVRDLKAFLDYADRGAEAIVGRIEGSVGGFDSPFEEAVAEALSDRGWEVEPQVGVSGFRIDLGVVDPDRPGAYLAGVECDGATYHRSAVARDRDKTRQQVLENLGWNIVRVWSPDWWYDAESAIEAVHQQLTEALDRTREERLAEEARLEAAEPVAAGDDAEPEVVASTPTIGDADCDSPFEEAVVEALRAYGWSLEPQVSVSGFRVDLGVVDPERPGAYLAGIECDGAAYHRSASARDRDKIRQQALEDAGWKIIRVWSTDWFDDPVAAARKIHQQLENTQKEQRRPANFSDERASAIPTESRGRGFDDAQEDGSRSRDGHDGSAEATGDPNEVGRPQLIAREANETPARSYYRPAKLPDVAADQERFFDEDQAETVERLASSVLEAEGPIRDDALCRRVARAYGFGRTGERIKKRILALLDDSGATNEPVGRFLWPPTSYRAAIPFRYERPGDEGRKLNEIAAEELIGLVQSRPDLTSDEDPALAFAREIGLSRLARAARERLEEALERTGERGNVP